MTIYMQTAWLFLLAIPIACIAWTVTHEEVFREPREYCNKRSTTAKILLVRKFFYLFTCEYCFSHYVTIVFIFLTSYKLLGLYHSRLFFGLGSKCLHECIRVYTPRY
jgi:hypothetical protein